jgi:branched-chain amino acid aminotransferase
LIGTGPRVGVKPSEEFLLLMFVSPVGPYFKSGFAPVSMLITRDYDRAAPLGTGRFKVGGNYAASLTSMKIAHDNGYANVIYLDAKDKKYIDECGPANFFGIKNNSYITPKSTSILPSITNKSLMTLAEELGMKVEQRPVELNELDSFEEVGACGTAAVISPIGLIKDDYTGREYNYGNEPGKTCTKLYTKLLAIQYGDEEDKYGWIDFVE